MFLINVKSDVGKNRVRTVGCVNFNKNFYFLKMFHVEHKLY